MLPIHRSILLLATCTAACSTTYVAPEAVVKVDSHEIEFPTGEPHQLEVHVRHGHVLVQDGARLGGDVQIQVRGESHHSASQRLSTTKLEITSEGGVMTLRVTHPENAPLDAVDVRLRLRVPPSVDVRIVGLSTQVALRGFRGNSDVRTDSGEILARPAGGHQQLRTDNGAIRLEGTFSTATLATDSGEIEVTLPQSHEPVALEAENETGSVLIDMSERCSMQLSYLTETGDLRSDFPVEWEVNGEPNGATRLFRGRVGDRDQVVTVDATVRSKSASFQVRRLTAVAHPVSN